MKSFAFALVVALPALAVPGSLLAQDAAVVNPDTVRVKLDNPHVRTLEAVLKPGQKENLHSHPASVIYVISGGKVRNHIAGGKTVESELVAGDTLYRDPITHWAENIGTTTIHLILIELKDRR
jgi:quercetin dioxygenase-like cupin family protein